MHGFRRTLFLSHLGLVALTILVLGFTLRGLATRFFAEQLRDQLISKSAVVRNRVAPLMDDEGFGELSAKQQRTLQREMRRLARKGGVRVRIINRQARSVLDTYTEHSDDARNSGSTNSDTPYGASSNGESLSDTDIAPELGWAFVDRPEVLAALQGETNSRVRGNLRAGSSAMFLAMPIRREGEVVGCVYLTAPVLTLTDAVVGTTRRLLYAALGIFLVAAILSVALAQRLALPARRLEETARRLAGGDLSARVQMHRRVLGRGDEMDRLTREFNAMAAQIERTDEERRAFLADVSHELRTPLTAIKGSAETLRDGAWQNPTMAPRFAETIVQQSDRMMRLVGDLLRLARLENAAQDADFAQSINAGELLSRAASAVAPLFDERKVRLNLECELENLCGNVDLLEQLLINLLANAARHSPDGSATILRAREEDGEAILEVRDSGSGIAPEHLPKLGQRFYRVEGGRDRESGGSGLGLAICRRIALAHGGRLQIESAQGQGTTVSLRLPQS